MCREIACSSSEWLLGVVMALSCIAMTTATSLTWLHEGVAVVSCSEPVTLTVFPLHLCRTRDTCTLLKMAAGSVRLMLELLSCTHRSAEEHDTAVAALRDMRVQHLLPEEAEAVLKRRITN